MQVSGLPLNQRNQNEQQLSFRQEAGMAARSKRDGRPAAWRNPDPVGPMACRLTVVASTAVWRPVMQAGPRSVQPEPKPDTPPHPTHPVLLSRHPSTCAAAAYPSHDTAAPTRDPPTPEAPSPCIRKRCCSRRYVRCTQRCRRR